MRYRHLLLIQILLWMFVISLVVHSKCIFTWTGFMANEAIISSVLDVLGLYVLRHVAFYFRAVGTFTTLPHSGRLTRYSIHLGLDQTHKLYHERKRFQTCKGLTALQLICALTKQTCQLPWSMDGFS